MNPIRISAVSYLNTLPFIYGITESGLLHNYELNLDVPSGNASRLLAGQADLGLVPVGALPAFNKYHIVGNLCLGAVGDVKTVLLLSNAPVKELKTVYLDRDSRTSVNLVRILAIRLWKADIEWKPLDGIDLTTLKPTEGVVLIGDKTFGNRSRFQYCYDLAGCWHSLTGLPFVFALWISTSPLPGEFIRQFSKAIAWGVQHSRDSIRLTRTLPISENELIVYLEKDISYEFDERKKKGLDLFLSWLKEIQH